MPPLHINGKPHPPRKASANSASAPASVSSPLQLAAALGLSPDPVQEGLLTDPSLRIIINCCRQWGKSTITAVQAIYQSITQPNSLSLVLSPSGRQSGEFLNKVRSFLPILGIPIRGDGVNEISALFPNRSRIVGLPGNQDTIRGFSGVSLLIIDEAARVTDDLYHAIRPAIATNPNARIWMLSTPNGREGFFYDTFHASDPAAGPHWKRVSVPASACPRIAQSFLDEQRATMPQHQFRMEYCCEFLDSGSAVISSALLQSAYTSRPPLAVGSQCHLFTAFDPYLYHGSPHFFLGLDLGQAVDPSALCIVERADFLISDRPDPVYFRPQTERRYTIRYLERLRLGRTYPEIARYVADVTRHPLLDGSRTLVVDATGVGRPFLEMLRAEHSHASICPVLITGGENTTRDHTGTYHVPRNHLLSAFLLNLQKGALKISQDLLQSQDLIHELTSLRYNGGRIETAKSTQHDDLVFAAALATWRATAKL